MSHLTVKASSDEVGLRREAGIESAGLPTWLARLHRSLPTGAYVRISVEGTLPLPFETFTEGAGFREASPGFIREHTLPDLVGPGLKAIVCGLNPSPTSAETGIAFGHKGNRFWPAAVAAGLVTTERRPDDALMSDRVGFTDLAKRCTPRASDLSNAEFQAGLSRLERLIGWTQPKVLIVVGLSGWRIASNKSAQAGWQPDLIGSTPVYLMPNTSGLNTHENVASLASHFSAAIEGR